MESQKDKIRAIRWQGLFFLTILASFAYVFLEWLFVVTRQSYLSNVSWLIKLEILFFVTACAICFSFLLVFCFYLLGKLLQSKKIKKIIYIITSFVPSFILASLTLLLFDNFTYTMFQFGIVSSVGILRAIYALGFFIVFVLFTWKMHSWSKSIGSTFIIKALNARIFIVSIVLIVLSLVVPLIHQTNKAYDISGYKTGKTNGQLPNIFLITADGLNADHMSIYGYDRRTTPFLEGWDNQSMVIENGFTNSAKTTGSIVSILNGKYATDTRVLYPPDILTNEDSYQHLPGILKSLGYYTIQYGQSYYADAYAQNMLKGFDEVFNSSVEKSNVLELLNSILPEDIAYFVYDLFNRFTDRLFHIFYIKEMDNVFLQVTGTTASFEDYPKLHHMFQLIENVQQPLFVHLHWMGTHGEYFYPKEQVYSAETDIKTQEPWNDDFYDDSILEFDETIQGIVDFLEDNNLAENTVFVIASDHGQKWMANERLPLIFHFPQGEYAAHISINGQNIDIAPTLLDYLGIKIPDWMDGISLLTKKINPQIVFSSDVTPSLTEDEKRKYLTTESYDPPFFQFGKISIIDCDRFYELQFEGGFNLVKSTIENYETQCNYQVSTDTEAVHLMIDHLAQNKFDTSTLEEWLKSFPSP